MHNNLDGDATKSYRMNTEVMFEYVVSHKYNSNSLAAVFHIDKSNAAGNSKRLYTPALDHDTLLWKLFFLLDWRFTPQPSF